MIFMPTRNRRKWLENFFRAYAEFQSKEPGVLLLDNDDSGNYKDINLPQGWGVHVQERTFIGTRFNLALKVLPNEDVYAIMPDDVEPMSRGWDSILRQHTLDNGVAWPDDMYEHKCTIPWISGDLVRKIGFLAPPGIQHLYIDTFWSDVQEIRKKQGYCEAAKVKHHWNIDDQTHNERRADGDDGRYYTYKNGDMRDVRERLHA